MSASAATTPASAMPAPTQNAAWKPEVSACGTASPAFVASVVCATATEERTAIPSAPPICCDVLIRPDATPASSAGTPASAAIEMETNENAIPTAVTRKPGRRSPRYEPSTETCVKYRRPIVRRLMPVTSTGLTPTRVTSICATIAQTIEVPATAMYATPVLSGE